MRFLKTVVITPTLYVDLVLSNSVFTTFVMHKRAEPNHFSAKETIKGDVFDETVIRLRKENKDAMAS